MRLEGAPLCALYYLASSCFANNMYDFLGKLDVGCADIRLVSEAIGLKLRQKSGNIYLHAQVFTGFMYVAAAICMWLLRAWKIAEVDELASHNEKKPPALNLGGGHVDCEPKSPLIRRLLLWKRV